MRKDCGGIADGHPAQTHSLSVIVLDHLRLAEVHSKSDPAQVVRYAYPISDASGAQTLSLAYTELGPGGAIPWHYDSTDDEVLLVLDGEVEVTVQVSIEHESATVARGSALHIPAHKPHTVRNVASATARAVHLFGRPAVTVTFADPVMPLDVTVVGGYGAVDQQEEKTA